MKKIALAAAVAVAMSLTGCASNPPLNFSVPNVGVAQRKVDADLRSITVSLARPDEAKGEMPAAAQHQVPEMWQSALTEALNRMVIFSDSSPRKVNLSVKVLKLDIPAFGASMKTSTIARYEIIDREDGSIIYTEEIAADGEVPFNYAFAGVTRARESINRAVQNNIAKFLQSLETVDVNRPMFPATREAGQP